MSVTPLCDFVPTNAALALLGSSVKTLPTIVPFPNQPDKKLYLYPDGAGVWGYCQDNGFAGDLVDLLKQQYSCHTLMEVLRNLETAGVISNRRIIPAASIYEYEIEAAKRNTILEFWEDANDNMRDARRVDLNILQKMFGPITSYERFYNQYGRFIGFSRSFDVPFPNNGKMAARRNKQYVVIPFFDLPGRISKVKLYYAGPKGILCDELSTSHDGGVYNLDYAAFSDDVIVGVNDPLLALRIQALYSDVTSKPLSVVSYLGDTKYWPLWNKRIIFWSEDPDSSVFKQAKLIPNSSVSFPRGGVDLQVLTNFASAGWMNNVVSCARPWVTALKEKLLTVLPRELEKFMGDLELSNDEKSLLLFDCSTPDEKEVIRGILEVTDNCRIVGVGGTRFAERGHKWYYVNNSGRLTQVMNGSFRIDRIIKYGTTKYYSGSFTLNNKTMLFRAPVSQFDKNTFAWLRDFATSNSMGLMQVPNAYRAKLFDIASSLNGVDIPTIEYSSKIGWTSDKISFRFPGITLTEGLAEKDVLDAPDASLPCSGVSDEPVNPSMMMPLFAYSDVNRYFWAITLMVCRNILAKFMNVNPAPLCVTGNYDMASKFVNALSISHIGKKDLKSCLSVFNGDRSAVIPEFHDIPYFVNATEDTMLKWLHDASSNKNVIVATDMARAFMLGEGDWTFLTIKDIKSSMLHVCKLQQIIFSFVRQLQLAHEFSEPDCLKHAADLLKKAISSELLDAVPDFDILNEAALILKPHTPIGVIDDGLRFLMMLATMQHGYSKADKLVSIKDDTVLFSRLLVQSLPIRNSDTAVEAAMQSGGYLVRASERNIVVKKEAWQLAISKLSAKPS